MFLIYYIIIIEHKKSFVRGERSRKGGSDEGEYGCCEGRKGDRKTQHPGEKVPKQHLTVTAL